MTLGYFIGPFLLMLIVERRKFRLTEQIEQLDEVEIGLYYLNKGNNHTAMSLKKEAAIL